jgi:GNAT superfamily N-acetyltransferase
MTTECRRLTDHDSVFAGIDVWNRAQPDFSIPDRLVAQNVFAPFDGIDVTAWGGFEDDELVGVALSKRLKRMIPDYAGPESGWLSLFAVDDQAENRSSVASDLLDTVEGEMAERGVASLRFGGDPGHFLPGVPSECPGLEATLRDAGFSAGRTFHDVLGDLDEYEPPNRIAAVRDEWSNLTLERVGSDVEPLLDFLSDQFPGRWQYEAENFTRVPGGGDDYWFLRNEGTPVGFGRTNTPESGYRGGSVNWADRLDGSVCGLGPLGVHEAYRGRGWGLWLVATIAERYRDTGYDRMVIDWTDLVDYYAKLGFEPWLAYTSFTKEIGEEVMA